MRERQNLQLWPVSWPGFTWTVTEYGTEPQVKQEAKENNMENNIGKFWIVVNPNDNKVIYKGNRGGYHKHTSEQEAISEAQRLTQTSGIEYVVMGVVAQVKKVNVPSYTVVKL